MSACYHQEEPAWNSSNSSAGGGETLRTGGEQKLKYHDLPTATSIRLLDIIESKQGVIRCNMRVIDQDDDHPKYAAISYTWGNPITVYEEPMPDTTNLKFPEDADQLPFSNCISSVGPEGEVMLMVDGGKLDYYAKHQHVPHEEVCWKKGTPRKIEVNRSPVFVEENLFFCLEALAELREKFNQTQDEPQDRLHDTMRQPLWVDALCINQADLAERAMQVQLMGRIFKSADVVFAWVGQADRLSIIAHSAINMILDFDATRSQARDSSNPDQQEVSLSSIPGMTVVHWFALFALFQRLWFRRAWVAQEAAFAKNMIMVCGASMLSMNLLLAVFAFLDTTGLDHDLFKLGRNFLSNRPVSGVSRHWEKVASLCRQAPSTNRGLRIEPRDAISFTLGYHHVRGRLGLSNAGMPMLTYDSAVGKSPNEARWHTDIPEVIHLSDHTMETVVIDGMPGIRYHRRPLRLLSVLSDFRDLDATDPRDKIFAFLNLAEDELGLVPDYYADVRDVFRKATEAMIRKTWTLSVLSHVQDPSETRIKGLPSWVPDFSARLGRTPFDQGGENDRFRAGVEGELTSIFFNSDGTLTISAIRVDNVSISTDLDGDAVIQAVKLALNGTANYPIEPLAWWYGSRRQLRRRAVNRVEALWRTLIADDLVESDEDYGALDSKNGFGIGFANWILTDILEARDLLVEYIKLDPDHWTGKLVHNSFCTRMALWSAMRDGSQLFGELEVPDLAGILDDITAQKKHEDEVFGTEEEAEPQSVRKVFNYLPTARHISESFRDPADYQRDEDPLTGKYKMASMLRLTPLERRKLRNFEKHMRKATEGRKLFLTGSGLFGLGPKALGQDPQRKDEVWILQGARVPFILRKDEDNRYSIVGEAYVHGIMYGEADSESYDEQDICLI